MPGTNGNDHTRVYLDAVQAQLGERVTNLGRRQTDLENEMRTGFRQIEQSIAGLSTTMSERNKPQWQALSVMLAFAAILGGLAYMPIREATSDLKTSVAAISSAMVTRDELNWRSDRTADDRTRTDANIMALQQTMLPRNEWAERNLARDRDIENLHAEIIRTETNLQRQLDLQRSDFTTFSNSMGNGRDVIQDMKDEVDRLREQLSEIRAKQYERMGVSPG